MTLTESIKNLPIDYLKNDKEIKEVYAYLKEIFEKEIKASPRKGSDAP